MDNNRPLRFLIISGEVSGDLYGSVIIEELRKIHPNSEFFGVGGQFMAEKGIRMLYNSSHWGSIGYIESLKRAPYLFFIFLQLKKMLIEEKIDLLVCIDFPGFNMRLVRYAKSVGIPTLYLFPPAKFASDPADVTDAARNITQVAASFRMTYDLYKKAGANVEFVGHPIVDFTLPRMDRAQFVAAHGIPPERKLIGLLPGSRHSEIDQLLPVVLESAQRVFERHPNTHFVIPLLSEKYGGDTKYKGIVEDFLRHHPIPLTLLFDASLETLQNVDCAVVTSGTATLEAAYINVPMVIIYKVSLFTALIARLFNKIPKFIGLPNLVLNERIVPELVQDDLNPVVLGLEIEKLLYDETVRAEMRRKLQPIRHELGERGVSGRLARLILKTLGLNPAA